MLHRRTHSTHCCQQAVLPMPSHSCRSLLGLAFSFLQPPAPFHATPFLLASRVGLPSSEFQGAFAVVTATDALVIVVGGGVVLPDGSGNVLSPAVPSWQQHVTVTCTEHSTA